MERRKDTPFQGVRIPRDYLTLIEGLFLKTFDKKLVTDGGKKESFIAFGEIFADEVLLVVSLKNPTTLRMTTCYASVDYPAPQFKAEQGKPPTSVSKAVEHSVNQCVDAIASFFNTLFSEGRPVDYDEEYRQNWTPIELDKKTIVYLKINRDNTEIDAQADELLEKDEAMKTKKGKKLH